MTWEKVNITDVLWFQEGPGVRNTQFRESGIKLLNVGNINDNILDLSTTKIHLDKKEISEKYQHFLADEGDLVIASSGVTLDTFHKKIAWVRNSHLPLCMNTSTIRFKTKDPKKLSLKYFSYYLRTTSFNKQLRKLITGSAQLNFGPLHLRQMWLPLPPLHIQEQISDTLEKADALRKKDQELLQKYDELAQSLFNSYIKDNIKYVNLADVTERISDGVHFKPDYKEEGVPFISVKNITKKVLDFSDCKYVSQEDHDIMIKRCNPHFGDILYTKVGATYGRAAVVDTTKSFSLYVSVCLIKPNKNLIRTDFLHFVMNSDMVKEQADKSIKGAGVPDLHLVEIKKFLIPLPSLNLQDEFCKRLNLLQESRKKITNLSDQISDGLSNKYFS